ncbi:hypothetical protein [Malaciobacter marinus]|uniref:hypothetical protein n=1 Tax=Malaciobacter TaxID=2321114 RepID=UPI0009A8C526|nr:hypothetical protein [Malaciobacter marinus]SKB30835.1 hypothetical protein SAMN06295997_104122 [Malaciobacter marinus]
MYKNFIFIYVLIILFSGCASNSNIKSVFQTQKANEISKDYKQIMNYLHKYKVKLDKRNPKYYNKTLEKAIYSQINSGETFVTLRDFDGKKLQNFKQYLDLAFDKKGLLNRNDYLILGVYYMIYDAYLIAGQHKFTALNYDKEKLEKLYKNLHILKWKIRTSKDINGNYLFLTWQNNWQVEYMKKRFDDLNNLKDLKSIVENKESLLSHSNFSFEVLLSLMIHKVENSLEDIGAEPSDITFDTLTSLVFII